jgi:hypothetical protein
MENWCFSCSKGRAEMYNKEILYPNLFKIQIKWFFGSL